MIKNRVAFEQCLAKVQQSVDASARIEEVIEDAALCIARFADTGNDMYVDGFIRAMTTICKKHVDTIAYLHECFELATQAHKDHPTNFL